MVKKVMTAVCSAMLLSGCYDLEDGSVADIFDLLGNGGGEDEDSDTDPGGGGEDSEGDADTDISGDGNVWSSCFPTNESGEELDFSVMKTGDACSFFTSPCAFGDSLVMTGRNAEHCSAQCRASRRCCLERLLGNYTGAKQGSLRRSVQLFRTILGKYAVSRKDQLRRPLHTRGLDNRSHFDVRGHRRLCLLEQHRVYRMRRCGGIRPADGSMRGKLYVSQSTLARRHVQ